MIARGHHNGYSFILVDHLTLSTVHVLFSLMLPFLLHLICSNWVIFCQWAQAYGALLIVKLTLGVQLELMVVVVVIGQP